jgi:hypothetical protein
MTHIISAPTDELFDENGPISSLEDFPKDSQGGSMISSLCIREVNVMAIF